MGGGVGETVVKSVFAASEVIRSGSSSAKDDLVKGVLIPSTLLHPSIKLFLSLRFKMLDPPLKQENRYNISLFSFLWRSNISDILYYSLYYHIILSYIKLYQKLTCVLLLLLRPRFYQINSFFLFQSNNNKGKKAQKRCNMLFFLENVLNIDIS